MRQVLIAYKDLPHYRVRFFEELREKLASRDVNLRLVYGQPSGKRALKKDTAALDWAQFRRNRVLRIFGRELIWQPVLHEARSCDLVIVEQASRLLANYPLLLWQHLGGPKVCLWGHGRNFQAAEGGHGIAEAVKRVASKQAHWWFAYNETSADIVTALGFPRQRIVSVQNAIDTAELVELSESIKEDEVEAARALLGLKSHRVGVFVGGMYPEKRLPFLLEACARVKQYVPDFEALFIGGGECQDTVAEAAVRHDWIHYVGPRFGREKVLYFKMGRVVLMPGLVGLGVLDAFALGVPMVTTAVPYHSPEIEYLENGRNGLVVSDASSVDAYAEAVVRLLTDDEEHSRLVAGCTAARNRYTVSEMVDRFVEGVEGALRLAR